MNREFDPARLPLGPGTTVIEAGAGTGKTHNIAAIVVRAVADGAVRAEEVLLITFTRRATAELRSRVHQALVQAAGESGRRPDQVERLRQAAADFDRATIMTTSAFFEQLVSALGIHVDHDPSSTLLPDGSHLAREVTEDLYLRELLAGQRLPSLDVLGRGVARATARPWLPLLRRDSQASATTCSRLARARADMASRKQALQVHSFEDTLQRLCDALNQDRAAVQTITSSFRLVLVDEFQDTDVLQWKVLDKAFGHGKAQLVLIGDPKQSIYAFRNADVHAYLAASHQHAPWTLTRNHRSTAELLQGINAILHGASLGEGIQTPTAHGLDGGLDPAPWPRPTCLRLLPQGPGPLPRVIADEVAATVAALQQLRPHFTPPHGEPRLLQLNDIAVLVRRRASALQVAESLSRAGIPAVHLGGEDVMRSAAARDWRVVMTTLLNLHATSMRRAALTTLVGWRIPDLVGAEDARIERLAHDLRELSLLWRRDGFAVMADSLADRFDLHERLLTGEGERQQLSDLLQVAEVVHAEASSRQLSPEATLAWLEQVDVEVPPRRGSDEPAVQIMTVHAAKGLGFPVVLLPDLWDPPFPEWTDKPKEPRVVHVDGEPMLDPLPSGASREDSEESLRLAYVAMTRAQAGLKIWLPESPLSGRSSILRLLKHTTPGTVPPAGGPLQKGDWEDLVTHLRSPRFAAVTLEDGLAVPAPPASAEHTNPPTREARPWTRRIDQTWRRTSYTGLTAELHHLAPGELAASAPGLDEPDLDQDEPSGSGLTPPRTQTPSLLAHVPGGTWFGTLVHAILEHVDPQSPDLRATIAEAAAPWLRSAPDLDGTVLVDALEAAFHTPLDPLTPHCLADIPVADRLPELDFEMTMGRGREAATVGDLAALFQDRSLLPADDPLADYGDLLAATPAADQMLRGYLNGSIDAVLRLREDDRYLVVDYKTNRLPTAGEEELSLEHHSPAAMAAAMKSSHYPLQALLYTVALHRWLSWRLPGYDPHRHLGGVGYLFVRGMGGPQTPMLDGMRCGVFSWFPGADFVLAADRLIAGGAR